MNPARIAELLEPFLRAPLGDPGNSDLSAPCHSKPSSSCHSEPAKADGEPAVLSPAQLQDISTYIDILIRWNARINLTAIRDPEDIVTRHFGESLFAARHLVPVGTAKPGTANVGTAEPSKANVGTAAPGCPAERSSAALTAADIGSGAGFPGLPIKLWSPHISLTLIESNHKKVVFLREVTRALTLTNVNIQNVRAESVTRTFSIVTLRAVGHFEAILPTAGALVAPSGRLALLISAAQQEVARSALRHFKWSSPAPVPQSRSRILLVGRRP
jgi:16S rRNA (guanine527-N7)-methyltransferase